MTIKVTTTQTVEENVEVTLPAFRKNGSNYYMIEVENKMVYVSNYDFSRGAEVRSHGILTILEDAGRYEVITKEEFDAAFNQAMNQLRQYQKEAV